MIIDYNLVHQIVFQIQILRLIPTNKTEWSIQWNFICESKATKHLLFCLFDRFVLPPNWMFHHYSCEMRWTFIFTVQFTFSTKNDVSDNTQWTNNCQAFWVVMFVQVEWSCWIEIQTKMHANITEKYWCQNAKIDRKLTQCYQI